VFALFAVVRAGSILLLMPLTACSATDGFGASAEDPSEAMKPRDLGVEWISAGAPGRARKTRVVLAPLAADLSGEVDAKIPDSW
jgi:hypothetical protein